MGYEVKVAANGRVVIPHDVRVQFGIENGGMLILNVQNEEIVLQTRAARVREAQRMAAEMLAGYDGNVLDDFLADRQEQRDREFAKAEARDATHNAI